MYIEVVKKIAEAVEEAGVLTRADITSAVGMNEALVAKVIHAMLNTGVLTNTSSKRGSAYSLTDEGQWYLNKMKGEKNNV